MGNPYSAFEEEEEEEIVQEITHNPITTVCCAECFDTKRYLKSKSASDFCSRPECFEWENLNQCNECKETACEFHMPEFEKNHRITCNECNQIIAACAKGKKDKFVCKGCLNDHRNYYWKNYVEESSRPKKPTKTIRVVRKIIDGCEYYWDKTTDKLYNPYSKECVGFYDIERNKIIELEYDESGNQSIDDSSGGDN
jgi:hypothetical protein